jgi:hypothetical protein
MMSRLEIYELDFRHGTVRAIENTRPDPEGYRLTTAAAIIPTGYPSGQGTGASRPSNQSAGKRTPKAAPGEETA